MSWPLSGSLESDFSGDWKPRSVQSLFPLLTLLPSRAYLPLPILPGPPSLTTRGLMNYILFNQPTCLCIGSVLFNHISSTTLHAERRSCLKEPSAVCAHLPQLPLQVSPAQRLSYSGVLVACPTVSLVLLTTSR